MRPHRTSGFSLIEIALVLVVIGILMAGAVAGVGPVLESSKTSTTNSKLDRIELALLAYVMQNGCLPCPANGSLASANANAGWSENSAAAFYGPSAGAPIVPLPCAGPAGGTGCIANAGAGSPIGVVPWNTLGLREADIVDAWNSRISYAVTPTLTVTPDASMQRSLPTNYPVGTLAVSDNTPTQQTATAAYVLISYGRDRTFAFTSNGTSVTNSGGYVAANPQGINSPSLGDGLNFRQSTVNLTTGATYFDDIVRFRTAPNIIQDCGPNACGNPPG